MRVAVCEKRKNCLHFRIERLVKELGGLGNEDLVRIKSGEEFIECEKKIKNLFRLVCEFKTQVEEYYNSKGAYPCVDPMQIAWGRRKHIAGLASLERKKELIKKKTTGRKIKSQEEGVRQ